MIHKRIPLQITDFQHHFDLTIRSITQMRTAGVLFTIIMVAWNGQQKEMSFS